jgi:hypothetical protein
MLRGSMAVSSPSYNGKGGKRKSGGRKKLKMRKMIFGASENNGKPAKLLRLIAACLPSSFQNFHQAQAHKT